MNADVPEIVVSVDLGTTYTGVAWKTPRTPIQVISDWPGSGDRAERKVPTTLVYNADGTLSSWGAMCADDDEARVPWTGTGKVRREFFKIFMEPETLAEAHKRGFASAPKTTLEAQQFVTDYLRELYAHVKESIEIQMGLRNFGGWKDTAVLFLFSVPTTWTSLSLINQFKAIICNAGFGVEGPRHSAQVDLTEAEAAAVATLKTSAVHFNMESLFLAVDAGGGTTDLALMKVTSVNQQVPQMSSMHQVSGIGIGATLIDQLFVRLVAARLAQHPDVTASGQLPPDYALRLARSHHFRTVKHKFGERAYMQPQFRMPLDGVAHGFSHAGLGIENGRMIFTLQEIQSLFDPQIEAISDKIIKELNWLQEQQHPQKVQYIVLSGGLGSSAYVRDQLQQRFSCYAHPSANNVAVIPCSDPQLVVVRGLLLSWEQQWLTGGQASVLATRIARASFGVIIMEEYNPSKHFLEDAVDDPFDKKKKWALNQIQWLIRKGDVIDPNVPIIKQLAFNIDPGASTRSWSSEFVSSQVDPNYLPNMKRAGVATKICEVQSDLSGVEETQLIRKFKRRRVCFWKGRTWYICEFEVRVIVGPADLRFELWFQGKRFSGNHDPIKVTWEKD
ncbi:hypothetical protein GE09DRAFT_950983 [Coniochaeta sp. 2T2.1]|nr:hypothetical protein GE09DRAFT_950983 [Coniochaeta sp. 2T2.1]